MGDDLRKRIQDALLPGMVGAYREPRRRCAMTLTRSRFRTVPVFLAVVALSSGVADAADKSKVDAATRRVDRGAKQIGQGQVGPAFKEMFTGVGHTVVEGAKFSGQTIKEAFTGKK
jgi:hypothetical protein